MGKNAWDCGVFFAHDEGSCNESSAGCRCGTEAGSGSAEQAKAGFSLFFGYQQKPCFELNPRTPWAAHLRDEWRRSRCRGAREVAALFGARGLRGLSSERRKKSEADGDVGARRTRRGCFRSPLRLTFVLGACCPDQARLEAPTGRSEHQAPIGFHWEALDRQGIRARHLFP